MIRDYMAGHAVRKLHIGCSDNTLPGWLNSDLAPVEDGIIYLNATASMPFEDCQFDRVFSEHMIEHVPYEGGASMLKECFRVLKPGGRVRISTPDLAFLVDLYRPGKSVLQEEYVAWSQSVIGVPPHLDGAGRSRGREVFVINNFFRAWGHRFIYDEETLRTALEDAGFESVVRCALNESDDVLLQGLENDRRMPDGFLHLETLTLEGTRRP
jgi:predicted SAM-dependent methyltransferase